MSFGRWMDKKAVIHTHNGILPSYWNECIWISSNEVDETGAYYTEWSKSERKTTIQYAAASAAKLLQSCPTLCDPIDGSQPGSPIPGILQARTLEWVAISLSNAWNWKVKVKSLSRIWLLATPWTAAYQAPPSMGFSRQEYRSGVPVPSPLTKLIKCNKQLRFIYNTQHIVRTLPKEEATKTMVMLMKKGDAGLWWW